MGWNSSEYGEKGETWPPFILIFWPSPPKLLRVCHAMPLITLTSSLFLSSYLLPGVLAVNCYALNQQHISDYVPCNASVDGVETHSACCDPRDVCMASGLCLSTRNSNPNGLLWVDACTDQTFKNENCPHICVDAGTLSHLST